MKKQILIVLTLMLAAVTAKAQYFQHTYGYGPEIGTITMNGMVTTSTGAGHLVGGQFIDIQGLLLPQGNFGMFVLRTDADGRFTSTGNFNNHYVLNDGGTQKLRLTASNVIEFKDGSGYGAIGTFHSWLNGQIFGQGVAYIRLDATGAVLTVQGYSLSSVVGTVPFLGGIREDANGTGDIFATGTNGDDMWAMRINQNGTLLWGNLYHIGATPNDIIESPYGNSLYIVGNYNAGFWMEIDPVTGGFVSFKVMSSFFGTGAESLVSIDPSADPSMPGFIVAGESDGKTWVTKTDQLGNMQWSGQYWSATTPTKYMRGYDAVGRPANNTPPVGDDGTVVVKPTRTYEYYVTGPYWSTTSDGDAYVFKLDNMGNPINPNGLFLYNIGFEETGISIDVNTSGTADGVSMYAVKEDDPRREVYVVKAYFNGQSGCNEYFEDLQRQVVEFFPNAMYNVSSTPFSTATVQIDHILTNPDNELCHNTTISGGSNARIANPNGAKQATISPNPIQQGAQSAVIEIESETPVVAEVAIYDMLGKQYYTGSFSLIKGNNQLPVNLSTTNMAAGMYTVKVRSGETNKNILLMVK